jgi:hypothetical protein
MSPTVANGRDRTEKGPGLAPRARRSSGRGGSIRRRPARRPPARSPLLPRLARSGPAWGDSVFGQTALQAASGATLAVGASLKYGAAVVTPFDVAASTIYVGFTAPRPCDTVRVPQHWLPVGERAGPVARAQAGMTRTFVS